MNEILIDSLQDDSCFPPLPFFAPSLITSVRALHTLTREVQVLLQKEFTYILKEL